MRNTLKTVFIVTALMFTSAAIFAQESVQAESAQSMGGNPYTNKSVLILKNHTGNIISVACVYFEPIDNCWISRGWWNIPAHGSSTLNFGVYTGNVYIHGQQKDWEQKLSWGHGHWFCVKHGNEEGFRLMHPEQTNGCEFKKEFSRVELVAGADKEFEFNP